MHAQCTYTSTRVRMQMQVCDALGVELEVVPLTQVRLVPQLDVVLHTQVRGDAQHEVVLHTQVRGDAQLEVALHT
jgi:hypothetical protein